MLLRGEIINNAVLKTKMVSDDIQAGLDIILDDTP